MPEMSVGILTIWVSVSFEVTLGCLMSIMLSVG